MYKWYLLDISGNTHHVRCGKKVSKIFALPLLILASFSFWSTCNNMFSLSAVSKLRVFSFLSSHGVFDRFSCCPVLNVLFGIQYKRRKNHIYQ